MKEIFGCEGPPQSSDGTWQIGPSGQKVTITRCPAKELEDCQDIWELLRAGRLSDWRLSLTEQERLPERYLEAWVFASREVATRTAEDLNRS